MRQEHRAGEKLFIDFAGQTLPIVDSETAVVTQAELFVAVLGASNYTYAEAVPSQELPYWIAAHTHAFGYLRGCPRLIICDYVPRAIIGPQPSAPRSAEQTRARGRAGSRRGPASKAAPRSRASSN
jgi:transposase